jgi:hypothetical protein
MRMSNQTLDQRVENLERLVKEMRMERGAENGSPWRKTLGAFRNDEVMRDIVERGAAIRKAERQSE